MPHNQELDKKINLMQRRLQATAKRYNYNFGHPRVLELSQQLDQLIFQFMNRRSR